MIVSACGFLRSVKKPTAMGMAIKIRERQSNAKPTEGGSMPEFWMPLTSVLYGILPVAVTAPNMHISNPQQPHVNAVATVAIMPVFLFIMTSPCVFNLNSVYIQKKQDASFPASHWY